MGYMTDGMKQVRDAQNNALQGQLSNSFYVDPKDDEYASKINAKLLRADYEDAKATFRPVHERFISAVTSDDLMNEQLGRVGGNVSSAFERGNKANEATMSRMGLSSVVSPSDGMSKANAIAGAENNIRDYSKQRSEALMGGSPLNQVSVAG